MATKVWSSTAPAAEFRPYVGAEESLLEFTVRTVIFGALFGVLFRQASPAAISSVLPR